MHTDSQNFKNEVRIKYVRMLNSLEFQMNLSARGVCASTEEGGTFELLGIFGMRPSGSSPRGPSTPVPNQSRLRKCLIFHRRRIANRFEKQTTVKHPGLGSLRELEPNAQGTRAILNVGQLPNPAATGEAVEDLTLWPR